jgi:hypothetical protein
MIEADLGGFSGALTIRPTDFGGQSVDGWGAQEHRALIPSLRRSSLSPTYNVLEKLASLSFIIGYYLFPLDARTRSPLFRYDKNHPGRPTPFSPTRWP